MRSADAEWYSSAGADKNNLPIDRLRWRHLRFFADLPRPGGKLLEIGCGTGYFLAEARRRGYRVSGMDIDPEALAAARSRHGIEDLRRCGPDTVDQPAWRESFDVVVLFEVLEHVEAPADFLSSALELLKPGGFVAVTLPNRDRWPDFFGPVDGPPLHLTRWSGAALSGMARRAGLVVLKMQTGGCAFDAFLLHKVRLGLNSRLARRAGPSVHGHAARRLGGVLGSVKEFAAKVAALPVEAALRWAGSPGDYLYVLAVKP